MVYEGKPSTGCQNCRKRKIKCDEAKPACSQCVNTKRMCPGYVKYFDLVLRDQTQSVRHKAERRAQKQQRTQVTGGTGSKNIVPPSKGPAVTARLSAHQGRYSIPRVFSDCPEQGAICSFFSNFVLIPTHPDSQCGFLEVLLPLYNTARHDSLLSLATSSVALAVSAANPKHRGDWQLGKTMFGKALRMTSLLVQDPIESIKDETLLAVLLLGFYERITTTVEASHCSGAHDVGALALIKHRAEKNYESALATRLLLAVHTQVVNTAIFFSRPYAKDAIDLNDLATRLPQNTANRLTVILAKAADFRALAKMVLANSKNPASEDQITQTLYVAVDVDGQLEEWARWVPESWIWHPASGIRLSPNTPRDLFTYGGKSDFYTDLNMANIWNSYRSKRLMILSIVLDCVFRLRSAPDDDLGQHAKAALETTQELVDDICASVPFHLGTKTCGGPGDNPHVEYPYLGATKLSGEQRRAAAAFGGWYLLEPLKTSLNAIGLRRGQKRWIMNQMVRIGQLYKMLAPETVMLDALPSVLQEIRDEEADVGHPGMLKYSNTLDEIAIRPFQIGIGVDNPVVGQVT